VSGRAASRVAREPEAPAGNARLVIPWLAPVEERIALLRAPVAALVSDFNAVVKRRQALGKGGGTWTARRRLMTLRMPTRMPRIQEVEERRFVWGDPAALSELDEEMGQLRAAAAHVTEYCDDDALRVRAVRLGALCQLHALKALGNVRTLYVERLGEIDDESRALLGPGGNP